MVARVEDSFLAREHGITEQKLPWKWNMEADQGVHGAREGEVLNSNSCYVASRSGDFPSWAPAYQGYTKGLEQAPGSGHPQPSDVEMLTEVDHNEGVLNSLVSSYLVAQSQAGATLAPGRAEVNASAPGLARNPSFESINNTGSCSTPSLCVGSPVTVLPSHPCNSGGKVSSAMLLKEHHPVGPYPESRESQLSDRSFSTESLSYGGSMEDRHAIVNCGDDFWIPHDMITDTLLPDFRFEPMLDDTADTGACVNTFSAGKMESLVSFQHGNLSREIGNSNTMRNILRGPVMTSGPAPTGYTNAAPDFCQSFLVGMEENVIPSTCKSTNVVNKPNHLAIPAKHSLLSAFNTSEQPGRLRWSDQPWVGSPHISADANGDVKQFTKQPEMSPVSLAGSTPSSPTTPLDPHLFATSLQCPSSTGSMSTSQSHVSALRAEDIQKKLTEFNKSNKRSFSTMQMSSQTTSVADSRCGASSLSLTRPGSLPQPASRIQALQAGATADKFDAASLSALLYSNKQGCQDFRSFTSRDAVAVPSAPKQRRRHGTATDPQSIAARTRREKFTDRIRILQGLVPNGERLDTVHMLSQTFEYVRFLQHKVWDLYNGKDSIADVKCEKWKEFMDATTGQVLV